MNRLLTALCTILSISNTSHAAWPPPGGLPRTSWGKEVSPDKPVLPEYPRPQLVRDQWVNLNGQWEYSITPKEGDAPANYNGKILVPFSPQSLLSGVNKPVTEKERIWYRRTIEIPAAWKGERVILNFGAVNWESRVIVNGKEVGKHTGGYDGFSFDITDALKELGPQELIVWAWNPIEGGQPRGKQARHPDGIFYTPTTGIWQTVWMEPVRPWHIDSLVMVPDIDQGVLKLTVNMNQLGNGFKVKAVAVDGRNVAGEMIVGKPGQSLSIPVPNAKLWSPASPFLYDLKVVLLEGDKEVDAVSSYFGMRKISIGPDDKGLMRMMLNNKPVFENGFLDQGFWPDGVYTAPSDEALKYDLVMLRKFGFNMDRKHIKVEPDRWYYWADKLGVPVWQDMPACVEMSYPPNRDSIPNREDNFESELRRMIQGRRNHPSVVMWILFNEGWGLPLKDRKSDKEKIEASPVARELEAQMVKATREEDPSRLIDAESGAGGGGNDHGEDLWDFGFGDVLDYHCYGPNRPVADTKRAAVCGEYGWGLAPVAALRAQLESSKGTDISGSVVTQLTDVENEHNGAMAYDRTVIPSVAMEKDLPGGILKVIHDFGYTDYPGGESPGAK